MNLQTILDAIPLKLLTDERDFSSIFVSSGYTSDMLSCVMTGAKDEAVWVTLMAHNNIIAVASLLGIPAIIITENAQPDENTVQRANTQEITLLSTPAQTFEIVGKLWELGLRST